MKITLPLAATLVIAMFPATSASALPLTYNSHGVVGTIDGVIDGGVNAELSEAQILLDLAVGGSINDLNNTPCTGAADNIDDGCKKANNLANYFGTLTNFLGDSAKIESPQGQELTVTGFNYVLAKYGGGESGYVLFYLPHFGNTIPTTPDNFWTSTGQYSISHLTRFNATTTTTVPDGGATLGLLGLALIGLSYVRRRLQ